ncbi:non-ribosomal peptide synthetase [Caulobacter sp. 17J65-9]|uniref:amino acid adenylation domain-containing protein n=1 Tax=Caulobacter sp. 17J65-9 TaxID=2709382 RepID=UPI0013C7DE47|nr:non-ribosomal peptide synthetase [Caulobacter sp. 17J65-9]
MPQRVAACSRQAPEAPALESGHGHMTYGELVRAADRLAAYLRRLGAGPDVPIGLCLPRSFERVVAALAIWRAGAAFVALDPDWPKDRIRALLDDAGAPVVVAELYIADQLAGPGRASVAFERDASAIDACPPFEAVSPEADALAYLVYTSGSTGAAKGVEITHGALLNLVLWHQAAFGTGPNDRASHVAGLGFDAAVWELWPALAAGATVVLADDDVRTSPQALGDWLVRQQISTAFVPTTLAEPLLTRSWPADTALRFLLTGADTLHSYPPAGLPFALVNNYGPTECTVVATSGVIAPEAGDAVLPSIGRPIAETQIHLLDSDGEPVADGGVGEIYIGGTGVGRGYRNRPDLTAERFVPDPFSDRPGARLYRTGDLGRRRPDGQIEFHGRIDDQVKIRGHRVEPDEVAAALNRHPGVAASAVVAREVGCQRSLAAYVVAAQAPPPDPTALREFLAVLLPEYMLPGSFTALSALPLTANGKLDKAALPEPGYADLAGLAPTREPQTPTEARLAEIVAAVLGLERVGVDDNFFLLGGHSLLATQVVMRAREAFGVEVTLRHLFEAKTVTRLAEAVEGLLLEALEAMSDEEALRLAAAD